QELRGAEDGVIEGLGRLTLDLDGCRGDVGLVSDSGMTVDGRTVGDGSAGRSAGGRAVDGGALERREKLVAVTGKALARVEELIEAADKGLILQAHAAHDGVKAVPNLFGILGLEIVVDKDDHRKRKGFRGEEVDVLLDVIFKNAKFVAVKIGNEVAGEVCHGDRQDGERGS